MQLRDMKPRKATHGKYGPVTTMSGHPLSRQGQKEPRVLPERATRSLAARRGKDHRPHGGLGADATGRYRADSEGARVGTSHAMAGGERGTVKARKFGANGIGVARALHRGPRVVSRPARRPLVSRPVGSPSRQSPHLSRRLRWLLYLPHRSQSDRPVRAVCHAGVAPTTAHAILGTPGLTSRSPRLRILVGSIQILSTRRNRSNRRITQEIGIS
jgi:hypothetical protein